MGAPRATRNARRRRQATIAALVADAVPTGLDPSRAAAVEAVDQILDGTEIAADTQQTLTRRFGDAGVVELVALCGLYALMGYMTTAFAIEPEPGLPQLLRVDPKQPRRYRTQRARRHLERQLGQAALPRLLPGWTNAGPMWCACRRPSSPTTPLTSCSATSSRARGYAIARHGEAQWNGVAILSRAGLEDVVAGIPGAPGLSACRGACRLGDLRRRPRALVYVPNGRTPDSEHYEYKLAWLAALGELVGAGPEAALVCGDMNIAPTDADVFDPAAYVGHTHVTAPERAALAELQALRPA